MLEKHNGNIFETFEARLVVLSITLVKLHFTKSPLAAMFLINFAQINRVPLISNINDCTKFEDNRLKQSGLRAHTSFKTGWQPSLKQDGRHKIFFQKLSPLTLNKHRKPELDILNCFALMRKSRKRRKEEKKFRQNHKDIRFHRIS